MSDAEKLVSHYRLKTLLRRDGFGAVYFSEDTRDQKECILRVIELDQATLRRITGRVRAHSQRDHPLIEQIRQRMKRVAELKNPHILPVIEFGEEHIQGNNDIIFYMVSPYEKESLLSYWSEHTSSSELISLETVTEILTQAAEALHYVHRRGLIHQYVRLSSFMLRSTTRSRRLHLYLTDFWFADISTDLLEEGQVSQDLSVYLASEQLAGNGVTASDQYALAILIYELLLGYRLSGVDLSLGLYERFLRQRSVEVSETELILARRLDLVLRRALAEDASSRYQNIDVFASTFRSVVSGEASEQIEEDTAKLPAIERRRSQRAEEVAAAGALAADEIVEAVAESQLEIDETARTRHPSLHKTVLTGAGMEVAETVVSSESVEETTLRQQETIVSATERQETFASETTRRETVVEEEETLTVIKEEKTSSSAGAVAGAAGIAGFAAGLAAGELLQSEADLSAEQTLSAESSATAFAAGEARQREIDRAREQELLTEGAAAGLVAGEVLQSEAELLEERRLRTELAEERQLRSESSAAAFAAGAAAGAAQQREIDSEEEKTERRESSAAAFAAGAAAGIAAGAATGAAQQREIDSEEEKTELKESSATAFAAGAAAGAAAGFAAGEARQREIDSEKERIERKESSAAAFAAGAAAGAVAGFAAGEALAFEQETDIVTEQTLIIPASGGAAAGAALYEQETDIAEERTQIIPAAGGAVLGGAAGLVAGELLAGEFGATEGAAGAGAAGFGAGAGAAGFGAGAGAAGFGAGAGAAGFGAGAAGFAAEAGAGAAAGSAGSLEKTQAAGAGVVGAGGMTMREKTEVSSGAAGLAGAGLAAAGFASGTKQAAGGGVIGGGTTGTGALPPPVRRRRRRRGRTLMAAILIALLLFAIFGTFLAFAMNQSSATVTVTRESHTISNTYLVTATTSTTTTSGQVQAFRFTQSASLSKSGQSTGYYSGSHSSGFIKFYNSSTGCGCPLIIPAGTTFTGDSGVTVVTDEVASVASLCYVTVHAHAVILGPGGNIPAQDVHASYNSKITATNPFAFSGGQTGQSNALVQQSDINHLAKSLQAQVIQSAQTSIQGQLQSNQHLFAQPDCRTKVKSDQAAGDYASSFTVTVSATCTAEAYDYSAAMTIVTQQVQTEASSFSSDQFLLVNGQLQTSVVSATVTDAKAGTLLLAIKAVGKWVHKLVGHLENLIAGKSVGDARTILIQFGASQVDINISGRDQNTLPTDSSKIKIVEKS